LTQCVLVYPEKYLKFLGTSVIFALMEFLFIIWELSDFSLQGDDIFVHVLGTLFH